ncbi:MAG: carbon-nitrogen hydrolase family protein [Paracoccus sp. (in: a-proteobacteria)]|uniref:carbon-nitrogen hydrolase family protein n=1 Tax=Paracoccus sp. TaxID=267 RepID=UPI0026DF05DB|nr:carbon-nitrogen hydrolase family protein [Paracoccus sp. (in: a-proteobacteria)]MDO5631643.1 carbon-nitrogen hydrolase family protein [Paracoccus sp. (in: a-proteobacteria)]
MGKIKVAVAQLPGAPDDAMAAAHQAADAVREAGAKGVRLVVFPEAFLGGYPKGASFGAPVGLRKPEGREAFLRYYRAAVDLDGPEVAHLQEACADTGVFTVIGVIERDGGTLYCTALYIDGARGLVGKHRKLMPTAAERLIWGYGDGSTMAAVKADFGTVGAVICWENYMPALRMHMYAQGVLFYCAPTVDDRDSWLPTMQHIAMEGRCFVLTACPRITRAAYPDDHECALGDDPDTVLIRGGSAIIGPLGQVLAGPDYSNTGLICAEVDTDDAIRGKFDFDVTGHYARPDIFQLGVDTRARSAVVAGNAE